MINHNYTVEIFFFFFFWFLLHILICFANYFLIFRLLLLDLEKKKKNKKHKVFLLSVFSIFFSFFLFYLPCFNSETNFFFVQVNLFLFPIKDEKIHKDSDGIESYFLKKPQVSSFFFSCQRFF